MGRALRKMSGAIGNIGPALPNLSFVQHILLVLKWHLLEYEYFAVMYSR
jgi:hypothetical protein